MVSSETTYTCIVGATNHHVCPVLAAKPGKYGEHAIFTFHFNPQKAIHKYQCLRQSSATVDFLAALCQQILGLFYFRSVPYACILVYMHISIHVFVHSYIYM